MLHIAIRKITNPDDEIEFTDTEGLPFSPTVARSPQHAECLAQAEANDLQAEVSLFIYDPPDFRNVQDFRPEAP